MNIGLFSDCYLPTRNGVATILYQAEQELARRGHRAVVFTVSAADAGQAQPGPEARGVHRFPSVIFRRDLALHLGLPRQAQVDDLVARERLDLIHTHTEFSLGWAGRRAAHRAGLPLVHTLHTLYPAYRHYLPLGRLWPAGVIRALLARFLAGCSAVVCPSEKGRAFAAAISPQTPATVIGNGISLARFDGTHCTASERIRARAAFGVGPDERLLLYVGRLAPEKRVLPLWAALQPLLRAAPHLRVLFVGDGPEQAALAAAVRAAGSGRQARFAARVPWERMAAVYASADLFVTASLSEIHPMTLIEATACGLPIVARRDSAFSDLVFDGFNGFLVDSDAEIADRLAFLLQDDAARQRCAENARTHASRFTIAAHVDRLEALYGQLTQSRSRKAAL